MKSADLRDRHDAPARSRLYFARMGAVVVEGLMRAGGVVVREVTAQQASEVPFVEHDDVIEAFSSNRPDDALGEGILPGRSRSEEHTSELQSRLHLVCRLLLEKKKKKDIRTTRMNTMHLHVSYC